ncbi:hypothetical protein PVAG01_06550 [Phlyctema vagabunda]|uniref:Aminoglycoside phosphotransferase domain-containing protein n=1 Tax=Phlyctema vagabunda TaxID=108571 RepID=A0ABR4PGG3_9HELO
MQFVAKHTTIPVPKVICSFTHNGSASIVMERIHGDVIGKGWVSRSAESKSKILSQLKGIAEEMHDLTPPRGFGVSNIDGGELSDPRIPGPLNFGPYETIPDFHRYLRGGLMSNEENPIAVNELIKWQDGFWPWPTFTHGDLSSSNILVRGDEIVGIVNWQTAGWLPPYWEYTMAFQADLPQNMS